MKKVITIREYDNDGRMTKETIIETYDDIVYPATTPYYPIYPITQPYYTTITV